MPWGAVAERGVQVLDLSIIKAMCVSEEDIEGASAAGRKEVECRKELYRSGLPPMELAGKRVILVDDGIATECSILAAIAAIRRQKATRVVAAVPVTHLSGCSAIKMEADEVVSAAEPEMFLAVSQWYEDFPQVSDEDVRRLLETAGGSLSRVA